MGGWCRRTCKPNHEIHHDLFVKFSHCLSSLKMLEGPSVPDVLQTRANAQEVNDATKFGPYCERFFYVMKPAQEAFHMNDETRTVRHVSELFFPLERFAWLEAHRPVQNAHASGRRGRSQSLLGLIERLLTTQACSACSTRRVLHAPAPFFFVPLTRMLGVKSSQTGPRTDVPSPTGQQWCGGGRLPSKCSLRSLELATPPWASVLRARPVQWLRMSRSHQLDHRLTCPHQLDHRRGRPARGPPRGLVHSGLLAWGRTRTSTRFRVYCTTSTSCHAGNFSAVDNSCCQERMGHQC